MSPRTAPASIEVSCPGSPTSTSRACGRTASTSRAMSESETIEVSSTITTSWGRRLPRWWRKRLWLSGRQPRSRCRVEACAASSCARTASLDVEPGGLLVHGLLQAGGRLARRRGEGDERLGVAGRRGLLGQQRDDPRDGRRLAGAGAAGDDGEAVLDGGRARLALALVVHVREQPGEPLGEGRRRRRRRGARRRGPAGRRRPGAPRASSGRGRARCRPVAAAGSRASSSPTATRPLASSRSVHSATGGQASAERSTASSASTVAVSRMVARST